MPNWPHGVSDVFIIWNIWMTHRNCTPTIFIPYFARMRVCVLKCKAIMNRRQRSRRWRRLKMDRTFVIIHIEWANCLHIYIYTYACGCGFITVGKQTTAIPLHIFIFMKQLRVQPKVDKACTLMGLMGSSSRCFLQHIKNYYHLRIARAARLQVHFTFLFLYGGTSLSHMSPHRRYWFGSVRLVCATVVSVGRN